jgi:zinc/manganese transport system substrate-binding protein
VRSVLSFLALAALVGGTAGCGGDDDADAAGERPQVVVTTSILGDIVRNVVGEQADVHVIMPVGADPHEFAASTRQAESMVEADLLVVNGAGFEQGMAGVIDGARDDGTAVFTFADHVTLRTLDGGEHEHDEGDDGHDHEGGDDPHLWSDPTSIAGSVGALAAELAAVEGIDGAAVEASAATYAAELTALDATIAESLASIPADRRVLVTNHEALGYFAHRYDLEVVGAVIPSLTTSASASAGELEALAAVIRERRVPAIFGETTQPTKLAEALADEVGGDVEVVELYTESLGEAGSGADTYVGMLRTDADRIAAALA